MKPETLIKRYSTFGYEPKGLPLHLEIEEINLWLLKKHNIYIITTFCNRNWEINGKVKFKKGTFWGRSIWHVHSEVLPQEFSTKKSFKDPNDAKFDMLRDTIGALRFQYY